MCRILTLISVQILFLTASGKSIYFTPDYSSNKLNCRISQSIDGQRDSSYSINFDEIRPEILTSIYAREYKALCAIRLVFSDRYLSYNEDVLFSNKEKLLFRIIYAFNNSLSNVKYFRISETDVIIESFFNDNYLGEAHLALYSAFESIKCRTVRIFTENKHKPNNLHLKLSNQVTNLVLNIKSFHPEDSYWISTESSGSLKKLTIFSSNLNRRIILSSKINLDHLNIFNEKTSITPFMGNMKFVPCNETKDMATLFSGLYPICNSSILNDKIQKNLIELSVNLFGIDGKDSLYFDNFTKLRGLNLWNCYYMNKFSQNSFIHSKMLQNIETLTMTYPPSLAFLDSVLSNSNLKMLKLNISTFEQLCEYNKFRKKYTLKRKWKNLLQNINIITVDRFLVHHDRYNTEYPKYQNQILFGHLNRQVNDTLLNSQISNYRLQAGLTKLECYGLYEDSFYLEDMGYKMSQRKKKRLKKRYIKKRLNLIKYLNTLTNFNIENHDSK